MKTAREFYLSSCEDAAVYYGECAGRVVAVRDKIATLWDIKCINRLSLRISKSKPGVNCFSIETSRKLWIGRLNMSQLGRSIEAVLRLDYRAIDDLFSTHKLSPHVSLFIEEVKKRGLDEAILDIPHMRGEDLVRWVDVLNGFVQDVRDKSRSSVFVAKQRNYHRSSQKNAKELRKYIDEIFNAYARVMVLRIDLGYKKDVAKVAFGELINFESVKHDREVFIRHLQEKKLKDIWVGHAWKLEYGFDKSFHYHMIVFLNGAVVRKDEIICKMIGDVWRNVATGGEGIYYNCNSQIFRYKRLGIGVIDHDDAQKVMALKFDVANYLTKSDHYARLMLPGNARVFGKGGMPKTTAVRKGRPRKKTPQE